jgi:hypothetical protein
LQGVDLGLKVSGNEIVSGKVQLSSLPRRQVPLSKSQTKAGVQSTPKKNTVADISAVFLSGQKFNEEIALVSKAKRRDVVADMVKWAEASHSHRVFVLAGLRRTGKTTSLIHLCDALIQRGKKVKYAVLSGQTNPDILLSELDKYSEICDVLILNEVTLAKDFLLWSNLLADRYATNCKIIISGTGSLLLSVADGGKLFDRTFWRDIGFISFAEHHRVLGEGFPDYRQWGGVMSRTKFSDDGGVRKYVESIDEDNLYFSLQRAVDSGDSRLERYGSQSLLGMGRGEFSVCVYELLRSSTRFLVENAAAEGIETCLQKELLQKFNAQFIGQARAALKNYRDISSKTYEIAVDGERYQLALAWADGADIPYKRISGIVSLLRLIGAVRVWRVLDDAGEHAELYFTQAAVRWGQATEVLRDLAANGYRIDSIPQTERDLLMSKIRETVEGSLYEECVRNHVGKRAFTARFAGNKEVDVVVPTENGIYLYEVKRSSDIVEEQTRWLRDAGMCSFIESRAQWLDNDMNYSSPKIVKRTVIYQGTSQRVVHGGVEIDYINIGEFLSK